MNELRSRFEYDAWANARTLSSIREQGDAGEDARNVFAHLLAAQQIWLERMLGDDPRIEVWPMLTLDQQARMVKELPSRWLMFLEELDVESNTSCRYRNSKGDEYVTPVRDILDHVLLHSAYHRGQVARLIREVGLTPAVTDYIAYVRSGIPRA